MTSEINENQLSKLLVVTSLANAQTISHINSLQIVGMTPENASNTVKLIKSIGRSMAVSSSLLIAMGLSKDDILELLKESSGMPSSDSQTAH